MSTEFLYYFYAGEDLPGVRCTLKLVTLHENIVCFISLECPAVHFDLCSSLPICYKMRVPLWEEKQGHVQKSKSTYQFVCLNICCVLLYFSYNWLEHKL